MANDLGNLLYRTLTMVEKYYQRSIPPIEINKIKFDAAGEAIKKAISALGKQVHTPLAVNFEFSLSLEKIWELINKANKYIEETKPWNLAKENKTDELKSFIRLLVDVIREVAEAILPFMPDTAASIKEQIGQDTINKGKPLFPRIEIKNPSL